MKVASPNNNLWGSFHGLGGSTDSAIVWHLVRLCGRGVARKFTQLRSFTFVFLLALPLVSTAQEHPGQYWLQENDTTVMQHSFFDKTNLKLQGINTISETLALLAIQSHDDGGGMARCAKPPCTGALAARGRTLDPFEKHFESYGYGWGATYRYAGGVGLNLFVAYLFHASGHHKLERWVPVVAIAHAQASTGYALTGSSQGKNGW